MPARIMCRSPTVDICNINYIYIEFYECPLLYLGRNRFSMQEFLFLISKSSGKFASGLYTVSYCILFRGGLVVYTDMTEYQNVLCVSQSQAITEVVCLSISRLCIVILQTK